MKEDAKLATGDGAARDAAPRYKFCSVGGALFAVASVALWVLYFVASPSGDTSAKIALRFAVETPRPVLLLAGDSLTEKGTDPRQNGWVCSLQHRYARSADVLQRGLSGYSTQAYIENAVPVIEYEMSAGGLSPALIIVWLGANDAALLEGRDRRKHVDVEAYGANLQKIVRTFRSHAPGANFLLITPPHVDDAKRLSLSGRWRKADHNNTVTGEYARVCVESAQALGVPVLDLYSFFNAMSKRKRNSYLVDGLHFTSRGNRIVDEQIHEKLSAEFPELVARLEDETWELPISNILD